MAFENVSAKTVVQFAILVSLSPLVFLLTVIIIVRPRLRNLYLPKLWFILRNQPSLDSAKQLLFSRLYDIESKDIHLRKENTIRILELGVDYGHNFKHYPKNARLVAVEINRSSQPKLSQQLRKFPDITLEKLVDSSTNFMADIPDNSIDAAISTQVMCTMRDPRILLEEVRRVLVKGGQFFFLEHVPYPDGTWSYLIQSFFDNFWQILAGCTLMNEFYLYLTPAGFKDISTHYREYNVLFYLARPHIYGVATK